MRRPACLLIVVALLGCSEEFNPIAYGERPYVVFALLTTGSTTQIVRVHETAPPLEYVPQQPSIAGGTVRLLGPEGVQTFRDTLLVPPAGSNDTASIGAFVLDPFRPIRGLTYTLNVTSVRGDATATMTVPGPGEIATSDFLVLQQPYAYPATKTISVRTLLSPLALGFVLRFVIEYERLDGGAWITAYEEVPLAYRELENAESYETTYPVLTRRATAIVTSARGVREYESMSFRNSEYLKTLSILYARYGRSNLRMKRSLIILTQADHHFFTYYSFANYTADALTVRVDLPDYSNVGGAVGFFGAMTTDTLAYPLQSDLSPSRPPS